MATPISDYLAVAARDRRRAEVVRRLCDDIGLGLVTADRLPGAPPRPHSRRRMTFKVGEFPYTVTIVKDKLVDREGCELAGQAIWDSKEILISGSIAPDQRMEVLLHELRHCWEFHCERPRSNEAEASFFAMVSHACHVQLFQQGGAAALLAMEVTSLPPASRRDADDRSDIGQFRRAACAIVPAAEVIAYELA